jgi:hypothetical protein
MPNGGSDCCGTCWFNARNKGQAGYIRDPDSGPDFCAIRSLRIDDDAAFYTYCCNHPHRRPDRDSIPIGPVFTMADGSRTAAFAEVGRDLWRPSPDTELIRLHLLDLLSKMAPERPTSEYPGISVDEAIVWQLGELQERRAMDGLHRVATFEQRTRCRLVELAHDALVKIASA